MKIKIGKIISQAKIWLGEFAYDIQADLGIRDRRSIPVGTIPSPDESGDDRDSSNGNGNSVEEPPVATTVVLDTKRRLPQREHRSFLERLNSGRLPKPPSSREYVRSFTSEGIRYPSSATLIPPGTSEHVLMCDDLYHSPELLKPEPIPTLGEKCKSITPHIEYFALIDACYPHTMLERSFALIKVRRVPSGRGLGKVYRLLLPVGKAVHPVITNDDAIMQRDDFFTKEEMVAITSGSMPLGLVGIGDDDDD